MRSRHTRYQKLFGVDDVLIGAAIGGLGSIFTNSTNASNNSATNAQNAANVAATNAANERISDKNNAISVQQAQINRDYQERLSNSAYQRSMADMYKAGLNPILAYQKGGASSPSGVTAALTTPHFEAAKAQPFQAANVAQDAVNTALSVQRAQQENINMKYTADNIQANTAKTMADWRKTDIETRIREAELSPAELAKMRADLDKDVYKTSAGQIARRVGTSAQEGERTVAPILNSAKSLTQAAVPWLPRETTRSGSRWDQNGNENHYQDTTFSNRFKGW